ncbi:MAG: hypothetical protein IJ848_02575 [Alphaproteobacteria bacterium]|nr:hypothetical protein [Alphaproteobacteria bacterium]
MDYFYKALLLIALSISYINGSFAVNMFPNNNEEANLQMNHNNNNQLVPYIFQK